jgi:hypothetical protein
MAITPVNNANLFTPTNNAVGGAQPQNANVFQADTFQANAAAGGGGGGGGGGGSLSGKTKKQLNELMLLNNFMGQSLKKSEDDFNKDDAYNNEGEGVGAGAGNNTGGPSISDIITNTMQKKIVAAMQNAKS